MVKDAVKSSPRGTAPLSVALTLIGVLTATRAGAGPITTNTALPVFKGEFIFRGQAKLIRSSGDPSPMDRDLTVWAVPSVGVYGVTPKLALFGVFPYLDKALEVTTPRGRRTQGDAGLGDSTFLARYTVGQWDEPSQTRRFAPFVGLKVPTGDDDERDSLGRLP
ncbi:MAG: transporter, partial [Candidatus Binatia bacterium]